MSRFSSRILSALLLSMGLLLQSCTLAPVTPPDYYVLPAPENNLVTKTPLNGICVNVGPLSLPGYLEKSSIALRNVRTNQVYITDNAVWGEPLEDGITRVLCATISNALAPAGGVAVPLRSNLNAPLRIYLIVAKFDGDLSETVTLDADWGLTTSRGRVLYMGHFTQHADAGSTFDTMVAAQAQLLEQLGNQISRTMLQMNLSDYTSVQQ